MNHKHDDHDEPKDHEAAPASPDPVQQLYPAYRWKPSGETVVVKDAADEAYQKKEGFTLHAPPPEKKDKTTE